MMFAPFVFYKTYLVIPKHVLQSQPTMLLTLQRSHNMLNDMIHPFNTHKIPKTCVTWIQNVIRYQKMKINTVKGK
jgi:hypothetical protein